MLCRNHIGWALRGERRLHTLRRCLSHLMLLSRLLSLLTGLFLSDPVLLISLGAGKFLCLALSFILIFAQLLFCSVCLTFLGIRI